MSVAAHPRAASTARRDDSPVNLRIVLPILLTATFVQLLDTTIVNVALPDIRAQLQTTDGQIQLVVAGYQLSFACVLLVAGRLGDLLGRKRLFLAGMAVFVAASAGCGLAENGWQLVGARLVQGAASGLMFPQVLSILQVSVPREHQPRAYGLYGATIGLSTVLGPVIGGVILDPLALGWEWVFWVNVPIGLAALVLGFLKIPDSRAREAQRSDIASVGLAISGLFMLLMPLVVGRDEGWPWWAFAAMAAALPVSALFVARQRQLERRWASGGDDARGARPLVSPALFRAPLFGLGLLTTVVFFAGVGPFFFVFIFSLQAGLGHGALATGLAVVPFAIAGAVTSSTSARLTQSLGGGVLVVGCALLLAGHAGVIATLSSAGPNLSVWQFAPALVVAGLGFGMFVAPVTRLVLTGIDGADAGAASGILATAQQVGGAAGVAVLGVIFFDLLGARPDPSRFVDALERSLLWEVGVYAIALLLSVTLVRRIRAQHLLSGSHPREQSTSRHHQQGGTQCPQ